VSAIGALAGGPGGAIVGRAAGSLLSKITGSGDYKVRGNSIMSNAIPSFSAGGAGVRICHREYIGDINGSLGFVNTTLNINPGLETTFPWLSTIAGGFEEYELRGLVFEYRPTSGWAVSSTSATLGVVVFATNYDVLDPPFLTKQAMDSYEFSTSSVPSDHMLHPVECAPGANPTKTLYIRTGAATGDLRLYDIGLFEYATQGMQSVYSVGELWVSYDVILKKPRISPVATLGTVPQYALLQAFPLNTADATHIWGTTGLIPSVNSTMTVPFTVGATTTGSLYLTNPGKYSIDWYFNQAGTTVTAKATATLGANLALDNFVFGLDGYNLFTSTQAVANIVVVVSSAGAGAANALTLSVPTGLSAANFYVLIQTLPDALL